MEIKSENIYVFQTDSDIVKDTFRSSFNYLIEYDVPNIVLEKPYCILYFASNDIYFPNTELSFSKEIINKDKYEWYGTRVKSGSKHIFLRDIKKQWYLEGINSEVNSIEKMLSFLQFETDGYKVITLGSSAGGFAAVLFGSLLRAERIYSFNGQFEVESLLNTSSELENPILFRERDNKNINKYYSLRDYLYQPNSIYYFGSMSSSWDVYEYEHVHDFSIHFLLFRTSRHGVPFLRSSLINVINLDNENLNRLFLKGKFSPFEFSLQMEGMNAFINLFAMIWNKFRRKYF